MDSLPVLARRRDGEVQGRDQSVLAGEEDRFLCPSHIAVIFLAHIYDR